MRGEGLGLTLEARMRAERTMRRQLTGSRVSPVREIMRSIYARHMMPHSASRRSALKIIARNL